MKELSYSLEVVPLKLSFGGRSLEVVSFPKGSGIGGRLSGQLSPAYTGK